MSEIYPYYDYFNSETNKSERVAREIWRWEAIYADGTELKQFDDETKKFHRFAEIDQSKLHVFKMVSDQLPQGFAMIFDPATMKLVHYYRNTVLRATQADEAKIRTYCFGYEKNINGNTFKHIIMTSQTGEFIITDDPARVFVE